MLSWMQLYPVDGAAHRVGRNDTAWSYRDAVWSGLIEGFDPDPANAEPIRRWCLGFWDALQPHSMGAGYVNFMMDEPSNGVRTAYREKLGRQAEGLFQREGCGGPGSTQPRPSRSSELDRTVGDLQPAGGRRDAP